MTAPQIRTIDRWFGDEVLSHDRACCAYASRTMRNDQDSGDRADEAIEGGGDAGPPVPTAIDGKTVFKLEKRAMLPDPASGEGRDFGHRPRRAHTIRSIPNMTPNQVQRLHPN